jgi:putative transposase
MGDLLPLVRSLQSGGLEVLADSSPRPDRVWNRIPDELRERIIKLAFDEPTLSPRELALPFTDTETISLINIEEGN